MKLQMLKDKRMIIISVCLLFMLASCLTAIRFLLAERPARELYLQAEGRNFKKYSDQIKRAYSDFYSEYKPYMDSRYRRRTELTADIKSEANELFGISNIQDILDIIRRCKLVTVSDNDPGMGKSLSKLSLLLEKSPLIDAEVFVQNRQMGFTIPVLLPEKYFILDLDKIDEVYSWVLPRYGMPPVKPKRILKGVDIAKAIQYSDDEFDSIIKDYGAFFSSMLEEDDVKYGEDITVTVGDKEVKGRKLEVVLAPDKTQKLLKSLIDKVSMDKVLLKLTYSNYESVLKLIDESGFFQLFKALDDLGYLKLNQTTRDFLANAGNYSSIDGFGSIIKENSAKTACYEGLKMTVVVDKSGTMIDRMVTIPFTYDSEKIILDIHSGSNDAGNGNFYNGFCNICITHIGSNGEKLSYTFEIDSRTVSDVKNKDEKGELQINYLKSINDKEEYSVKVKLGLDKKIDELTMKTSSLIKYDIELKGDDAGLTDKITGELNCTKWENDKHKTRNEDIDLSVNADLPSQNIRDIALELGIGREDKFEIEDFKLPDMQSINSVNLNTISPKELEQVEEEIAASFGTFYFNNKSLVDLFMGEN